MIGEDIPVLDKFRLLQDIGYDGVEIRSAEKANPQEVRSALDKTGLPVHGVVHSSNPDLAAGLQLAEDYGATSILVVPRYDKKVSLADNWNRDLLNLQEAAPLAAEKKIHLLIENVWASYLISAFDVRTMIDQVNSPWVQSYFDVGNNIRWGVPEHWVEHLGPRIIKLDIKEYSTKLQNSEGLRNGFNVELGEGSINWAAVRRELSNINFTGWATAEVKGGDRARLTDIAQRMDTVLALN